MKSWNPIANGTSEPTPSRGYSIPRFRDSTISRFLWFLAIATAAAAGAVAIWWGSLNQDEGWYLYAAKMTSLGYLPYRDYFFTQGPALPFVYAVLAPLWEDGGILGARIFTFAIGCLASFAAAGLAASFSSGRKNIAALVAFALTACNIYHVYFTTIPKTYALGTLFLTSGFLFFAKAEKLRRPAEWILAGLLMALASGTRISLALAPMVCGFALLFTVKTRRLAFLWFGIGAATGLFATYGLFALDPESLGGLLAAQKYHTARGGFDWMFTIGSISRLSRAYIALAVVAGAALAIRLPKAKPAFAPGVTLLACLAVMALQLSAPFPYDDYQVPAIPPVAAVVAAAWAARAGVKGAVFAIAASLLASFASPLLQEWATSGQDRFWSIKRESSALSQLRDVAREIEKIDPGGKMILTQDLYIAIETKRFVPRGFEMGPFAYFPHLDDETAQRLNVLNKNLLIRELAAARAEVAAGSGYTFAIAAPACAEVPLEDQLEFWHTLKNSYQVAFRREAFGQNNTKLMVLKRREPATGGAR